MSDLDISEFGHCDCKIYSRKQGGMPLPHWRSLVESKYLSHFELQGRDVTVTIKTIRMSEVIGSGGKKSKKALLTFEGKEKGMVAGVTVLSAIAGIYGDDYDRWVGQRITLYPTTTEASGKVVGTIRVRPTAPAALRSSGSGQKPPPAAAPPPPSDDNEDPGDAPSPEEMGS
jgi:hypothetical protein